MGSCEVSPVTLSHGAGSPATPRVYKLSLEEHPLARCNDGTAAYFVLRPGFGDGARRWHIFLEGGGGCGDGATCATRWEESRSLMSSAQVRDGALVNTRLEGIKSADPIENPDFYDATFVQIAYCSSDHWSGDVAATAAPDAPLTDLDRWHFRGRAITMAVIAELGPLGLGSASEVLLSGSSAGGLGIANQIDDLRALLPASLRVLALQDAGFGLFYPPYDPATQREATERPFAQELSFAAGTQAWGGRGDLTCEARAVDALTRAACRLPSETFPSGDIAAPMFIRQSQLDAVQTKRLVDPLDTSAPARAYRERFGAAMRTTLAGLAPRFSVFSTHDAQHGVMSTTEGWTSLSVDGVTLRDAVGAWYREPCAGGGKRIAP